MLPDTANPESGLEELERRELGLEKEKERQPAPGDHQQQQARAKVQREKKTATMRKLRAEGRC
jgi:hypothetical protein